MRETRAASASLSMPGGTNFYLVLALLGVYLFLIVYGIVLAHITGPQEAAYPTRSDFQHLLRLMFAFLCGGLAALPHWRNYERWAYGIYLAVLTGLVAVLFVGPPVHSARRWLDLGVIRFQVSEAGKIALVLALARHLKFTREKKSFRTALSSLFLTVIYALLIAKEPDLGTSLLLPPVMLAMLFCAGGKAKHIALIVFAGLLIAPFAYKYGLKDYQKRRLTAFISSDAAELDPDSVLQAQRAREAIAQGGLWGKEAGQDMVPLPEKESDFVFAVVAANFGAAGAGLLVLLYWLFFYISIEIGIGTHDTFGRLTAVGIAAGVAFQATVNIAMTLGLAPVTGMNLPLVSRGGSSLLATTVSVGLLVNIALRPPRSLARPSRHLRNN